MSSESFLFESESFKNLLTSLNNCKNVNIYCGAGVSIDRTGVSWESLVNEIFQRGMVQKKIGTDELRNAISSVVSALQNEKENNQVASLFCQFFSHIDGDGFIGERKLAKYTNKFVVPILKEVLYEEGWSEGYLLRNVVRLSILLSALDKNVTLLTTNYDVYIEKKFLQILAMFKTQNSAGAKNSPKVEVKYVLPKQKGKRSYKLKRAGCINRDSEEGTIELIYLHGRVPPGDMDPDRKDLGKKPFSGIVVLDEASYAYTRESTIECLQDYFGRVNSTTLIVGASITDTPLIDSLVSTRHLPLEKSKRNKDKKDTRTKKQKTRKINNKFAVISNQGSFHGIHSASGDVEATASLSFDTEADELIKQAYQYRASRLGIRYLYPIAHFQTAQLMEELMISAVLSENDKDINKYWSSQHNYSRRIRLWRDKFDDSARQSTRAHIILESLVKDFLNHLPTYAKIDSTSIRAEIWLSLEEKEETLTLFSTSEGSSNPPGLRKKEMLSSSLTSSVKAYLYGKPIIQDHSDLRSDKDSTRWQSFLSVPIFLNVEYNINGVGRLLTIRPGVVTICGLQEADLKKNFSQLSNERKEKILQTIIKHGQKICKLKPAKPGKNRQLR